MSEIKTYRHTIDGVEHTLVFNPDGRPRYTLDGKQVTGVTTILGMIAKPQLMPWVARLCAQEAFLQGTNNELREELRKYPKLTGAQAKLVSAKFPEFATAINAHNAKSDTAKDLGTLAHAEVEKYIRWKMGEYSSFTINPETAHMVQPFIEWAEGRVAVTPQEQRTKYNRNVVEISPLNGDIQFLKAEQVVFSIKRVAAGTFDMLAMINGKKYMCDFKTSSGIYGREYFYQTAAYRAMCDELGWGKDIVGSVIIRSGKDGNDFEVKVSEAYEADLKCFDAASVLYHNGFTDIEIM
jgi:hypothetical protein